MCDNRNEKLKSDFLEMLKIQNTPYLSWIATKGELPYIEEYLLTIKVRSYVLSLRSGRYTVSSVDQCTVKVTLWDSYPHIAPNIRMLSLPSVFHPDWYSKGTYCASLPWTPHTSLKDYLLRMIRTLCWEPDVMESNAPANYKALDWYRKHRDNEDLFPSDPVILCENTAEETEAIKKKLFALGEIVDSWKVIT